MLSQIDGLELLQPFRFRLIENESPLKKANNPSHFLIRDDAIGGGHGEPQLQDDRRTEITLIGNVGIGGLGAKKCDEFVPLVWASAHAKIGFDAITDMPCCLGH